MPRRKTHEDAILEALEPLRARREELVAEASDLKAKARDLDSQVSRIDKVLRAAQSVVQKPAKPKPKEATPATKSWAIKVLELMQAHPEKEDWRVAEMSQELGVGQTTLSAAVALLREQGRIRPTRGVRGGGHAYGLYK